MGVVELLPLVPVGVDVRVPVLLVVVAVVVVAVLVLQVVVAAWGCVDGGNVDLDKLIVGVFKQG